MCLTQQYIMKKNKKVTLIFIPSTTSRLLSLCRERKSNLTRRFIFFHVAVSSIFFLLLLRVFSSFTANAPLQPATNRTTTPKSRPKPNNRGRITMKHRSAMLCCGGLQISATQRDSGRRGRN
jgi:hypothetical protein